MLVALALTRGRHKTFPVLQLDTETVGDSTAIIADRKPESASVAAELCART